MKGHVDIVDHTRVTGWAQSDTDARYAQLEIVVDGKPVAVIIASKFRKALQEAGIGDGHVAFDHRWDQAVGILRDAHVEVRSLATGSVLSGKKEIKAKLLNDEGYQAGVRNKFIALSQPSIHRDDNIITLSAGVMSPSDQFDVIAIEGKMIKSPVVNLQQGIPGPWEEVGVRPYTVAVSFEISEGDTMICWELQPRWSMDSQQRTDTLTPLRIAMPLTEEWHTIPEYENWVRTSGTTSRTNFIAGGWYAASQIDSIINQHLEGRSGLQVLDWGSGCGRVLVPLSRQFRPDDTFRGVDVDEFNTNWCQQNIPEFECQKSDIYPPLPFKDNTFDVIYGISVMTHLSTAAQVIWIRELRRVLKPGGICILSARGDHTLLLRPPTPEVADDLLRYGISEHVRDPAIKVNEPGYYRTTYQLRQQVVESWGSYMPVESYLPCANNFLQDFVVMRKQQD